MSTYRNRIDTSDLETHPTHGRLVIEPDRGGPLGYTPRPEDRPAIALDVLGEVENPENNWHTPEYKADSSVETDADLAYFAYRNLKALAIRRERATKAEAEAKEAEAQLDAEAYLLRAAFTELTKAGDLGEYPDDWRAVARKARELHAEAGK